VSKKKIPLPRFITISNFRPVNENDDPHAPNYDGFFVEEPQQIEWQEEDAFAEFPHFLEWIDTWWNDLGTSQKESLMEAAESYDSEHHLALHFLKLQGCLKLSYLPHYQRMLPIEEVLKAVSVATKCHKDAFSFQAEMFWIYTATMENKLEEVASRMFFLGKDVGQFQLSHVAEGAIRGARQIAGASEGGKQTAKKYGTRQEYLQAFRDYYRDHPKANYADVLSAVCLANRDWTRDTVRKALTRQKMGSKNFHDWIAPDKT
jgi:hypothetical protein